ncbi:unnamed protein product [Amoebophrya sp. A25]|nr:unnamed protein product [Amoebophrya sp. A25]|eukprot:GSA25T00011562001.1
MLHNPAEKRASSLSSCSILARPLRTLPLLLVVLYSHVVPKAVQAEVHEFRVRRPESRTLEISHSVTVTASASAPGEISVDAFIASGRATERGSRGTEGSSYLETTQKSRRSDQHGPDVASTLLQTSAPSSLVQVILIRADDFDRLDREAFCCPLHPGSDAQRLQLERDGCLLSHGSDSTAGEQIKDVREKPNDDEEMNLANKDQYRRDGAGKMSPQRSRSTSTASYVSGIKYAHGKDAFVLAAAVDTVHQAPTAFSVTEPGMYYAGIANCGQDNTLPVRSGAQKQDGGAHQNQVDLEPSASSFMLHENVVHGRILVRSSHGYLPAVDAPALTFNAWMLVLSTAFVAWWGYLCRKWRSELVPLHFALSGLLALTWLVACMRYNLYSSANDLPSSILEQKVHHDHHDHETVPGDTAQTRASLLELALAVRFALWLVVCLAISLGSGTIAEDPKISALLFYAAAYVSCAIGRTFFARTFGLWAFLVEDAEDAQQLVKNDSARGQLSTVRAATDDGASYRTILLVIPEAAVFGFIVQYGISSYRRLKSSLIEVKQVESLAKVSTFGAIIYYAALGVGLLTFFDFCLDLGVDIHRRWWLLWVFDEGGPNSVFFLTVLCLLHLFQPAENFRFKCSSTQIAVHDSIALREDGKTPTHGGTGEMRGGTSAIEMVDSPSRRGRTLPSGDTALDISQDDSRIFQDDSRPPTPVASGASQPSREKIEGTTSGFFGDDHDMMSDVALSDRSPGSSQENSQDTGTGLMQMIDVQEEEDPEHQKGEATGTGREEEQVRYLE